MKSKVLVGIICMQLIVIDLLHAQNAPMPYLMKMDSLHQVLGDYQKEDQEKVRLMNQYARLCFYNQDFHKGFVAAHAARQMSEQLNFEEGLVMYYLTLAAYHQDADMRTYYQKKAQWLSKVLDEQLDRYSTYMNIPGYRLGVDFEKEIDQFNTTLKHFESLGDVEIQANVMIGLSYFYQQLGKEKEALETIEKVKVLFNAINEPYPVFLISLYSMNELMNNGKNEEAKEIEYELIELITQHENENTIGLFASAMATNYRNRGRWALAIEYYLKSLEVFDQSDDRNLFARTNFWLGISYENLNMNSKAVDSYKKSITALEEAEDSINLLNAYGTLVFPLIALDRFEEAKQYLKIALRDTVGQNKSYVLARYNDAQGQIYLRQGKFEKAIYHFNRAFDRFNQLDYNRWATPFMKLYLAECYLKINDYDRALQEGLMCLELETALNGQNTTTVQKKISLLLSEIYEKIGDQSMAYIYLKRYHDMRAESDRLDETNRIADAEVRSILDQSQKEIDELEKAKLQNEQESKIQKLWIFIIAGALLSALILSIILYRNNIGKQKANTLLTEQKEEIESTLDKLKSTQAQLIQSEKMASLGELTAGIAHEIQNPLNFVNNFSEVSSELVEELKAERQKEKKDRDEKLENDILEDIDENLNKINHHGQRASGIVKGMLEHSRTGEGTKEPTDLNSLADEYLRLAYHGLRAKDKGFNADFKTEFDDSLPKINVVPQDIGRVLLNLINNAFYACAERLSAGAAGSLSAVNQKATRHSDPERSDGEESKYYKPEVIVSTKILPPTPSRGLPAGKAGGQQHIEISVKDNGPGIPEEIKDKIFQPFFTTKPTGSGTGLGLSLSYDIVKAHGGEIKIESEMGNGSEFKVNLPQ